MSSAVEEMSELEALTKPVSAYIKRNFDPMTKVVISDERVDVYQGVMGLSFEDGSNFNKQDVVKRLKYKRGSLVSALNNHVKMWLWIANETRRRQRKVKKYEYFKAMEFNGQILQNSSFICDYVHHSDYVIARREDSDPGFDKPCKFCPIDWCSLNKQNECGSMYAPNCSVAFHWDDSYSTDYKATAEIADRIAELKIKEEYEPVLKAEEKGG